MAKVRDAVSQRNRTCRRIVTTLIGAPPSIRLSAVAEHLKPLGIKLFSRQSVAGTISYPAMCLLLGTFGAGFSWSDRTEHRLNGSQQPLPTPSPVGYNPLKLNGNNKTHRTVRIHNEQQEVSPSG